MKTSLQEFLENLNLLETDDYCDIVNTFVCPPGNIFSRSSKNSET